MGIKIAAMGVEAAIAGNIRGGGGGEREREREREW